MIYNNQFGFRSNHSISLLNTTEFITEKLDTGSHVRGIFIDLEKAFDTVNHDLRIEKLYYYGFRGDSQHLINYFLSNRYQYLSIYGFDSPQLPLLSLLHLNDLNFSVKSSTVSHFVDDTIL